MPPPPPPPSRNKRHIRGYLGNDAKYPKITASDVRILARPGGGGNNHPPQWGPVQGSRRTLSLDAQMCEQRSTHLKVLNRLSASTLSKADQMATVADGVREALRDPHLLMTSSHTASCRLVDLRLGECSCPKGSESLCGHLAAAYLRGGALRSHLADCLPLWAELRSRAAGLCLKSLRKGGNPLVHTLDSDQTNDFQDVEREKQVVVSFCRSLETLRVPPEKTIFQLSAMILSFILRGRDVAFGRLPGVTTIPGLEADCLAMLDDEHKSFTNAEGSVDDLIQKWSFTTDVSAAMTRSTCTVLLAWIGCLINNSNESLLPSVVVEECCAAIDAHTDTATPEMPLPLLLKVLQRKLENGSVGARTALDFWWDLKPFLVGTLDRRSVAFPSAFSLAEHVRSLLSLDSSGRTRACDSGLGLYDHLMAQLEDSCPRSRTLRAALRSVDFLYSDSLNDRDYGTKLFTYILKSLPSGPMKPLHSDFQLIVRFMSHHRYQPMPRLPEIKLPPPTPQPRTGQLPSELLQSPVGQYLADRAEWSSFAACVERFWAGDVDIELLRQQLSSLSLSMLPPRPPASPDVGTVHLLLASPVPVGSDMYTYLSWANYQPLLGPLGPFLAGHHSLSPDFWCITDDCVVHVGPPTLSPDVPACSSPATIFGGVLSFLRTSEDLSIPKSTALRFDDVVAVICLPGFVLLPDDLKAKVACVLSALCPAQNAHSLPSYVPMRSLLRRHWPCIDDPETRLEALETSAPITADCHSVVPACPTAPRPPIPATTSPPCASPTPAPASPVPDLDSASCGELLEYIHTYELGVNATDPLSYKQRQRLTRSIKNLSEEMYADSSHVINELVQNADDNVYDAEPALAFVADSSGVLIVNNERGFNYKDVMAMCDIALSTKETTKNRIGKFGIGFKSVFQITHTPYIYSGRYRFYFDSRHPSGLGYILPLLAPLNIEDVLPNASLLQTARLSGVTPTTLIWLPFKAEPLGLLDYMRSCPSLPLFLRQLAHISVCDIPSGEQLVLSKKVASLLNYAFVDISSTRYVVIPSSESAVFAFPFNPDTLLPISGDRTLFCHLPIRSVGLPFHLHASWDMPSTREDVKSSVRNRQILAAAAADAPRVFEVLRDALLTQCGDHASVGRFLLACLPAPTHSQGIFSGWTRLCLASLTQAAIICDGTGFVRPNEAKYLPAELRAVKADVATLVQDHVCLVPVHLPSRSLVELGIQPLRPEHLAPLLPSSYSLLCWWAGVAKGPTNLSINYVLSTCKCLETLSGASVGPKDAIASTDEFLLGDLWRERVLHPNCVAELSPTLLRDLRSAGLTVVDSVQALAGLLHHSRDVAQTADVLRMLFMRWKAGATLPRSTAFPVDSVISNEVAYIIHGELPGLDGKLLAEASPDFGRFLQAATDLRHVFDLGFRVQLRRKGAHREWVVLDRSCESVLQKTFDMCPSQYIASLLGSPENVAVETPLVWDLPPETRSGAADRAFDIAEGIVPLGFLMHQEAVHAEVFFQGGPTAAYEGLVHEVASHEFRDELSQFFIHEYPWILTQSTNGVLWTSASQTVPSDDLCSELFKREPKVLYREELASILPHVPASTVVTSALELLRAIPLWTEGLLAPEGQSVRYPHYLALLSLLSEAEVQQSLQLFSPVIVEGFLYRGDLRFTKLAAPMTTDRGSPNYSALWGLDYREWVDQDQINRWKLDRFHVRRGLELLLAHADAVPPSKFVRRVCREYRASVASINVFDDWQSSITTWLTANSRQGSLPCWSPVKAGRVEWEPEPAYHTLDCASKLMAESIDFDVPLVLPRSAEASPTWAELLSRCTRPLSTVPRAVSHPMNSSWESDAWHLAGGVQLLKLLHQVVGAESLSVDRLCLRPTEGSVRFKAVVGHRLSKSISTNACLDRSGLLVYSCPSQNKLTFEAAEELVRCAGGTQSLSHLLYSMWSRSLAGEDLGVGDVTLPERFAEFLATAKAQDAYHHPIVDLPSDDDTPLVAAPSAPQDSFKGLKALQVSPEQVAAKWLPNAKRGLERNSRVGYLGEQAVYSYLSGLFPDVEWYNQDDESGNPYDLTYMHEGSKVYVEVKSSSSFNKNFFEFSYREWEFAQLHGDRFVIFRVEGVLADGAPSLFQVVNPYKQWQNGKLSMMVAVER